MESLYKKTTKQTGPIRKYNCEDLFRHLYMKFIFMSTFMRFGFESVTKEKDLKQLLSSTDITSTKIFQGSKAMCLLQK